MIENEASVKGRVIAELLSHLTNDLQIGKKIKSGELRKRLKEPAISGGIGGCARILSVAFGQRLLWGADHRCRGFGRWWTRHGVVHVS